MKNLSATTRVYEVKVSGRWTKVRSRNMMTLNDYCKRNGIKDWRGVGIMSRSEMQATKSLPIV